MLIIFKHSQRFLTKSSTKVTVPFLLKMSSNTRSLRSKTSVKTENDVSDNKEPQTSLHTSKYFQNKQIKEEPGCPTNSKTGKGTKNAKTLKIKQEAQNLVKEKPNVSTKATKIQALKKQTKTKSNVSEVVKTEVVSDDDFIANPTYTNSTLEVQKGVKLESNVSTKTRKGQKQKTAIKTEPNLSEMIKTEVLNEDDLSTLTQKRKQVEKREKVSRVKTEHVKDVEDMGWEPDNWRVVLDNILQMRKLHVAPVDSLGCEECPEKGVLPEVFRYQTLISVMLSSQTRDEVTFAATQRLIDHGLTVDSILETSDEKIGELIYPAGFWKSKVKYIRNTTQILKDQYNGDIPRTFKDLCKLPGVGPKMANIVMSVGWNDTVGIAVDTHVHRISNRLGWVPKPTKDPEHTRKALEAWLPKDQWRPINLTLVGFGQTICKPVGPSCRNCLNSELCPFGRSTLIEKSKKIPKK